MASSDFAFTTVNKLTCTNQRLKYCTKISPLSVVTGGFSQSSSGVAHLITGLFAVLALWILCALLWPDLLNILNTNK